MGRWVWCIVYGLWIIWCGIWIDFAVVIYASSFRVHVFILFIVGFIIIRVRGSYFDFVSQSCFHLNILCVRISPTHSHEYIIFNSKWSGIKWTGQNRIHSKYIKVANSQLNFAIIYAWYGSTISKDALKMKGETKN